MVSVTVGPSDTVGIHDLSPLGSVNLVVVPLSWSFIRYSLFEDTYSSVRFESPAGASNPPPVLAAKWVRPSGPTIITLPSGRTSRFARPPRLRVHCGPSGPSSPSFGLRES